jgi:hypothetical protein
MNIDGQTEWEVVDEVDGDAVYVVIWFVIDDDDKLIIE